MAEHEWDHRYVINGEVTELSGDSASGVKVEVDCSEGATDPDLCGHNSDESERQISLGNSPLNCMSTPVKMGSSWCC